MQQISQTSITVAYRFMEVQGPALHSGNLWQSTDSGRVENGLRAAMMRRIWGVAWWETQYELTLCACSPEDQLYPGLHQEKHDQPVEEGDSAPALRQDMELLEQVQRRAMKVSEG